MFSDVLLQDLCKYHLLKHDFYKKWNEGALDIGDLQYYAKQYYKNVEAFPRYVSGVHSRCDSLHNRKILLENLIDEERGENNHPALWLKFANCLGVTHEEVLANKADEETQALVDGFMSLVQSSYAAGLGALFAYEQQVPEIAKSKIDGLKKFYNFQERSPGLEFFNVHVAADVWHSRECADLLNQLSQKDQRVASNGAIHASQLLWGFLDGVYSKSIQRH